MSRKANAASGAKKHNEEDRDAVLQAVVLADSFQNRFRPLTLEKPRCLLPLANTPLIEYTFEFLALAGVEKVYVFCNAHNDQIDEYIKNSKWYRPSSPLKLHILVSPNSQSVGDALRELDGKGLITTDFILVSGDIVSNLPLGPIIEEHRQRREKDKNAIMTMVLREASPTHRTRAKEEPGVFVIDSPSMRCVYYEEIQANSPKKYVSIPPELFKRHAELQVRNDLIDCYVDICSPDVLALFTENFDYQQIRRHFVHGILQDWELYGKTIHCHVATHHYAARVRNLQTYDAVTKDIVSRWTYPLCPDSNNYAGQNYQYQRGNIYKEDNVVLGRSCTVNPRTVIGGDTSIGEDSEVGNSVIGKGCKIGNNVSIEYSYLWDGVTIEDGCTIKNAVVGNKAVIGANSKIEPGAVISFGVVLAPKTVVPGNVRLTRHKRKADSEDEEDSDGSTSSVDENASELPSDKIVGAGGRGYVYEDSESADEDEADATEVSGLVYQVSELSLSDSSVSTFSDDEEPSPSKPRKTRRTSGSFATSNTSEGENEEDVWHKEAVHSLRNAIEHNHPVEVASLELNGLRMASDASWQQVRRAAATAFISRIEDLVQDASASPAAVCAQILARWKPLLGRMIHDKADQAEFMVLVQRECSHRKRGDVILLYMAQKAYDLDIVEEEALNAWWVDERSNKGKEIVKVREKVAQFIKWLAEAESEEEESEDEDEESD